MPIWIGKKPGGGVSFGLALGVRGGGGGLPEVYPAAVVSAGTQDAYDLRNATGWLTPPTKVVGTDALPSGWALSGTYGIITTAHNPDDLDGYDTNGRPILVQHNDATIKGCKIWHDGGYIGNALWLIRMGLSGSVTGLRVLNSEFDGLGEVGAPTSVMGIVSRGGAGTGDTVVDGNWFHGMGGDNVSLWHAGLSAVTNNRFGIGGWRSSRAHYDGLEIHQDGLAGPTEVSGNFFDLTPAFYNPVTNSAGGGLGEFPAGTYGRTAAFAFYNCPYGVDCHHNVVIGAEAKDNGVLEPLSGTDDPRYGTPSARTGVYYSTPGPLLSQNIRVYNNVFSGAGSSALGGIVNSTNHYGIVAADYLNNYRFSSEDLGGSVLNDNALYPLPTTVPAVTTAPVVTGTGVEGNTLTGTYGRWNGGIETVAYQWKRNGANISGATSSTYVLVTADNGTSITLTVTATNNKGSTASTSNTIAVSTPGSAPVNTVLPVVSGSTQEGILLSTTNGTWTGSSVIEYTYQWRRGGVDIAGATEITYLQTIEDVGATLSCAITATNSLGAATAISAGVGPVTPAYTTDAAITGIRAEGWSVDFTSPPTMDPVGSPRYVYLSRQGFDATGNSKTVSEPLVLTQRVRQAYPNQASLDASRVALSDYVYSTDTIIGGTSPTNSSAEISPKPIARWARPDRSNVTNILRLEVVAAHRNARANEEIACVKFTVTDGSTTVTQIISTSSILDGLNDRNPVIGYGATIDISSLADGQIAANAEIYPWIGGTASIQKSSDNSAGTRSFCPQIFRKGASRTVLYAYVDTTGNDTTGVASATAATAAATPCLTVAGAMAKLKAADAGGFTDGHIIRLKAGTQAMGVPANTTHSSISELIIEADPAAGSVPVFNLTGNWNSRHTYLRMRNITIARTTTAQITGRYTTLENVTYLNGGSTSVIQGNSGAAGSFRWIGCTFTGITSGALSPSTNVESRLVRGCVGDAATTIDPWCSLGNTFINTNHSCTLAAYEGGWVGFNRFNLQAGAAITTGTFGNVDGFAVMQNVIEWTSTSTTAPALRPSGDSNVGNVTHLVCHHNTMTGFDAAGRGNLLYVDTAGTGSRIHKLASLVGNIHGQINTKHDIFATTAGNVGGWPYMYGVGCRGEFSQFRDFNSGGGGLGASHGSFQQAYSGLNASIGTSNSVRNDPLFMDYKGTVSASVAGAGGGDYNLQAGSPAIGRVDMPVLRFDLAGVERSTSQSAAGAYEKVAA